MMSQYIFIKCLSPLFGILNNCNLWILLRKIVIQCIYIYILLDKNVIFMDLFAVKVDGNEVNPGI